MRSKSGGNAHGSSNHSHNISNYGTSSNSNPHKNENILCAVLALIKELNENELELIKRDIDKKLALAQQKMNQF